MRFLLMLFIGEKPFALQRLLKIEDKIKNTESSIAPGSEKKNI